jgi:hypothetical protein
MNKIDEEESNASYYVIQEAEHLAMEYSQPEDYDAAKLALLWCAFETEAIAQGLTHWRGAELGDV